MSTKYERAFELLRDAESFAFTRHLGQEYGDGSFVARHLKPVVDIVDIWTCHNADLMAAAWLHDVVEDTPTSVYEVEGQFGRQIASIVDFVTDQPGANRKERHENTYHRIARSTDAQIVKLADRCANMQACVQYKNTSLGSMYLKEWPQFKALLCQPPIVDLWNTVEWGAVVPLQDFMRSQKKL